MQYDRADGTAQRNRSSNHRTAKPEKIILFGSHARAENGPDSDIDLFVVWNGGAGMRKVDRRFQLRTILEPFRHVSMDILTYTEDEVSRLVADPRTLTAQIIRSGKVINEQLQ